MTNSRPGPCFITFHTADGVVHTDTAQLIPEPKSPSDPDAVTSYLVDYLRKWGFVRFKQDDAVEAVFATGLYRMTVQPE